MDTVPEIADTAVCDVIIADHKARFAIAESGSAVSMAKELSRGEEKLGVVMSYSFASDTLRRTTMLTVFSSDPEIVDIDLIVRMYGRGRRVVGESFDSRNIPMFENAVNCENTVFDGFYFPVFTSVEEGTPELLLVFLESAQ